MLRHGCMRHIGDGESTKVRKVSRVTCSVNGYLTIDMPEELKYVIVRSFMDICNERDKDII